MTLADELEIHAAASCRPVITKPPPLCKRGLGFRIYGLVFRINKPPPMSIVCAELLLLVQPQKQGTPSPS